MSARNTSLSRAILLLCGLASATPAIASPVEPEVAEYLSTASQGPVGPLELSLNPRGAKGEASNLVGAELLRDLSLADPSPTAGFHAVDIAGHRDFALVPPNEIPGAVTLRDARYADSLPELAVESGGRRYRVRFGDFIFPELAATKIHAALGYATRSLTLVRNLRLDLAPGQGVQLARHWTRSPTPIAYEDWLGEPARDARGEYVIARYALLEPLADDARDLGPWRWRGHVAAGSRREYRALPAIEGWIGAADLSEERNHLLRELRGGERVPMLGGFRYAFGNSRGSASPNLFGAGLVNAPAVVRAALERGDAATLTLLYAPYGAYRAFLGEASLADLRWMTRRMARFRESQLIAIFVESGYPEGVARLNAAKLAARLNELIAALGPREADGTPVAPIAAAAPRSIQDGEHIRDGVFRQRYDGFPVDLTRTALETLTASVATAAFDNLFALGEKLVGSTPTFSSEHALGEKADDGTQITAGPGWMVRAKRKVRANPNPTSRQDLYLVTDKVLLSVGLSVGVTDLAGSPLWANAGPAVTREYSLQRTAPDERSARYLGWAIGPATLLYPDLSALKPGESLGVRTGFNLNAQAGGGLRAPGVKQLRATGYVLGAVEWFDSIEARRDVDGGLALVSGVSRDLSVETKIYLRAFQRWFRVPVVHGEWAEGVEKLRLYRVGGAELAALPPERRELARLQIASALRRHSTHGLDSYFRPLISRGDFRANAANFDVFLARGALSSSAADERVSGDATRFYHLSRAARAYGDSMGAAPQDCSIEGVLEFSDAAKTAVTDSFLEVECKVGDEHATPHALAKFLELARRATGRRVDLAALDAAAALPGPGRAEVRTLARLAHAALTAALADVPGTTPSDRLDALVNSLGPDRMRNARLPVLLANAASMYGRIEVRTDALARLGAAGSVFEAGEDVSGPARKHFRADDRPFEKTAFRNY